jgi:hypothetical protein
MPIWLGSITSTMPWWRDGLPSLLRALKTSEQQAPPSLTQAQVGLDLSRGKEPRYRWPAQPAVILDHAAPFFHNQIWRGTQPPLQAKCRRQYMLVELGQPLPPRESAGQS